MKTILLAGLLGAIFILLYMITSQTDLDPCANQNSDIAAAIMSDNIQEQEDLASRAILIRGICDSE